MHLLFVPWFVFAFLVLSWSFWLCRKKNLIFHASTPVCMRCSRDPFQPTNYNYKSIFFEIEWIMKIVMHQKCVTNYFIVDREFDCNSNKRVCRSIKRWTATIYSAIFFFLFKRRVFLLLFLVFFLLVSWIDKLILFLFCNFNFLILDRIEIMFWNQHEDTIDRYICTLMCGFVTQIIVRLFDYSRIILSQNTHSYR